MRQVAILVLFLVVTAAVAAGAAQFSPGDWYASRAKPTWTPPNGVFAPVWTVFYVAIAVAGWLVWRARDGGAALALWVTGLILNGLWSWLFFGLHAIGWALLDIGLLWVSIIGFIVVAWPRSRAAALLFLPYLAWVSYAALLNGAIWRLNG